MKKFTTSLARWGSVCVLLLLSLFVGPSQVSAKELPPGLVIGDQQGFYATSEGEYFIELDNVLPGETYTKTITIRNVDLKEGFEVFLQPRAGTGEGPINFEEVTTVQLTQDGTTLYEGGLLKSETVDWENKPLSLGIYESGGESVLKATFTVDKNLGLKDYKTSSNYTFYWVFTAQAKEATVATTDSTGKKPILIKPKTTPKDPILGWLPKTGEEWENFLYKLCAGLFLLALVVLVFWRHNKDQPTGK